MKSFSEKPDDTATTLPGLLGSLRSAWRDHWRTMIAVTLATFAISLTVILLMVPRYEATARVRIDPSRNPLTTSSEEQASLGSEAIETEATVLGSPELARQVVRRLNLVNDPEFTKGLNDGNTGIQLTPDEKVNKVTDALLRDVSIGREKLTYVISIQAKSRDADKAADLANAFANTYIDTRVGSRIGTAEKQADFFRQRLSAVSKELNDAQQKAAAYRASTGIAQGAAGATITDQQVGPISAQLATAEAQAAEARSNLSAARTQIARGGLDSVSAVRTSPVIADLRRQRAEVERNRGEAEGRYGPRHPEAIKIRDQLAGLDAQIDAEAKRAVGSLEAEAGAADAQAASLRATLRGIRGTQAQDTKALAVAAGLDQDVANKKQAYDRLSEMSLQSTQSSRDTISQAEIIDRAQRPSTPAGPRRLTLIALAALVSVALGFAVAVVLELLRPGLQSISEVEERLDVPVVGALPKVKTNKMHPAQQVLAYPTSMYSESLRNTLTSIVGAKSTGDTKVVAITSAVPGEGKTVATVSLARMSAMTGTRTLLIECDIRRAQVSAVTGHTSEVGLLEVLEGSATLENAIVHDEARGLDILLVAQSKFTAQDVFGGGRLSKLIAQARASYSLVLLDLPPVLGLADARTVSAEADAVILAIRWNSTSATAVEHAAGALRGDGAPLRGAMLTLVDPGAEAIGGLYYSSNYASYYTKTN
jgi:capsular exopolysaccharide synthesis family protein